jgi:uncharacterized protein YdhG (YjbR/CyaY superfamily)
LRRNGRKVANRSGTAKKLTSFGTLPRGCSRGRVHAGRFSEARFGHENIKRRRGNGCDTKKAARSVEEYIAAAPEEARAKLREIRAAIMEAAPKATEGISYQIPSYTYKGPLVWFGLMKEHVGLYVRPPVIEEHKKELAHYETTISAVRIPLDEEIPVKLVKRLVRARLRKNESGE